MRFVYAEWFLQRPRLTQWRQGKTTTTERMLYYSGFSRRIGGKRKNLDVLRLVHVHQGRLKHARIDTDGRSPHVFSNHVKAQRFPRG